MSTSSFPFASAALRTHSSETFANHLYPTETITRGRLKRLYGFTILSEDMVQSILDKLR